MNSSFLYHAWGLYTHECTREEYKGNLFLSARTTLILFSIPILLRLPYHN